MDTRTRWFTLILAVGLACQPGVAGTILGTDGRKCFPPTFSTTSSNGSNISVYGSWIENIGRVTTTAPGVTVTIIGKFNGLQNNTGQFAGQGRVDLKIATNNATPGNRTISLINDGVLGVGADAFSLPITVVALPTVTSVNVPALPDPFNDVTVTLNGTGLQDAKDPAAGTIVISNLVPFVTVGGNASVSSVRVLSSSATSMQVRIFFTALVQDATVELLLMSSTQCAPLNLTLPVGFKTKVHVKSTNVRNYVKSFSFPHGSTFAVGSVATININLLFPAPPGVRGNFENSIVSFKLVPGTSFEAVVNGTPINAGGFTVVKANQGEDIIPITFKVKDCGGGTAGNANTVKLQTWMHSTNTNLPPDFVETTFSVQCTQ